MNGSFEEYLYTPEMIEACGGIENVNRFVEGQKILERRFRIKQFFRKLAKSIIKLFLVSGIIILLFKIFI